jgi:hypothetical protein
MEQQLNPDKILELEFEYIKDTANQTIDDRYKFLNFYIGLTTLVATVSTGLLSLTDGSLPTNLRLGLGILSLGLAVVGWVFLAMFIRLRQAWHESIRALNTIKNFYTARNEDLNAAFAWDMNTIPKRHKLWNIHFYSSLLIILINSGFLGTGAILIMTLLTDNYTAITSGIVLSLVSLTFQILIYRRNLAANL